LSPGLEDPILPSVKTTMSTKGQILLPAELRRQDHLSPGQEFEIDRINEGEYRLTRTAKPRNRSLVTLLLACPVKGWFKPAARTETTDGIRVPTLG